MIEAPLNKIAVEPCGDIRVGNAVFRAPWYYVRRGNQDHLLRDVLEANGYVSPLDFVNNNHTHSETVEQYSHLKGFYEMTRLTGGSMNIENYDLARVSNKYCAGILGPGFLKKLRGVMYREWLLPFEGHLNDLGVIQYGINGFAGNSPEHTYMLRKSAPLIRQLIDDNLLHLASFVMLFRRSPQELKALFGKGLWRQLSVNSKSRNKLILLNILSVFEDSFFHEQSVIKYLKKLDARDVFVDACNIAELLDAVASGNGVFRAVEIVRELNKIPSSYLAYMDQIHISGRRVDEIVTGNKSDDAFVFPLHHWVWPIAKSEKKLCAKFDGKPSRFHPSMRVRALVDMFSDTYEMSVQLNKSFNPKWSLKRMQETHALYSKELSAREYSSELYAHCADIPSEFIFNCGGIRCVAELVSSPLDVAMLGKAHFNCLASFAGQLSSPDKLLFRVVVGSEESACLLYFQDDKWAVSQHYHPQNVSVGGVFLDIEKLLLSKVGEYSEVLRGCAHDQLVGVHRSNWADDERQAPVWGVESLWAVDPIPF